MAVEKVGTVLKTLGKMFVKLVFVMFENPTRTLYIIKHLIGDRLQIYSAVANIFISEGQLAKLLYFHTAFWFS